MREAGLIRCFALLAPLGVSVALAQSPAPAPNSKNARLVTEFKVHANQYLAWRQKTVGAAPSPTDSPEKLDAARNDLANKIRTARAGTKQGAIFTASIADYFRNQISATLKGPHGKEIRATLRDAEPVKMDLQINQSYPANIPLQSTPPTLLLNLPELPKGLEYRIIDRELVLRDTDANIVVDYIPNAMPGEKE